MVIFAVSNAYCKIFHVFTIRMDFFFFETGGIKDTLAVKVPPILPLPWLVSEKNDTISIFGFT